MPTIFPMIMNYLKKNWTGVIAAVVVLVAAKYAVETFFPNTTVGGAKKKKAKKKSTTPKSSSSKKEKKGHDVVYETEDCGTNAPTPNEKKSALKERNDKFGTNSYYYAHSKKYVHIESTF
jgi:hypothetical protein